MKITHAAAALGASGILLLGAAPAFAGGPSGVPFKSAGSGTETSLSAQGCQFAVNGGSCTVRSDGTATSSHMGTGPYTSTLTVDWLLAYSNGNSGYCAPASGSGTITAANGDTLTQNETGIVCEVGASADNVPHTFKGDFTDTGGTGRFAGATGGGSVTGGDDGAGNSFYSETGTISY